MNRRKIEVLIISILTPLVVGAVSSLLSGNSSGMYADFVKPPLSPPGIVFPIVWTILYILMGVAAFFVFESESPYKKKALQLYNLSLVFNFFWSIIFFGKGYYLLAFVWLIALIIIIINVIILFYKVNKLSAYLMIPYLLWCLFAAYLNFGVYLLNP